MMVIAVSLLIGSILFVFTTILP